MSLDPEAAPTDLMDRLFEILVFERLDQATVVADDVMVVMPGGVDLLIPERAASEIDLLDQAELFQLFDRPVDGRSADTREPGVHVEGRDRTALGVEEIDHLLPR